MKQKTENKVSKTKQLIEDYIHFMYWNEILKQMPFESELKEGWDIIESVLDEKSEEFLNTILKIWNVPEESKNGFIRDSWIIHVCEFWEGAMSEDVLVAFLYKNRHFTNL